MSCLAAQSIDLSWLEIFAATEHLSHIFPLSFFMFFHNPKLSLPSRQQPTPSPSSHTWSHWIFPSECRFILPQTTPAISSTNPKSCKILLNICIIRLHLCYVKYTTLLRGVCYLTIISSLLIDYLPLLGLSLLAMACLKVFASGNSGKLTSTSFPLSTGSLMPSANAS